MTQNQFSLGVVDQMLTDDMGRFFADPLGWVRYSFEWGRGELEAFQDPDEWQIAFLKELGEEIKKRGFNAALAQAVEAVQFATASGHGIGKSALVAWLILFILSTRPHARGVVTANTVEQLATKTWPELAKWRRRCITGHWFYITTGRGAMKIVHRQHPETWRADAQSCDEHNSEAFAGLHNVDSSAFYIFDEASRIPDKIWEVAEGGLTDGEPFWFVFGNPTRPSGRFYECFHRFRHRWKTRQIDSRTVVITNKKQIAKWIEDYGDDSDFVRVRVKGQFPAVGDHQFIGTNLVEESIRRQVVATMRDPLILGVDVARFGTDKTVLRFRRGRDARTIPARKYRGKNTMQVASIIAGVINEFAAQGTPIAAVFVDGGGVGGGVVDRLHQLGHKVIEVGFGEKARNDRDYANRRTELWADMRKGLAIVGIDDDPELRADLVGPEFDYTPKEQLILESKDDMQERGVSSPNDGDALALTYAEPVAAITVQGQARLEGAPVHTARAIVQDDVFDRL